MKHIERSNIKSKFASYIFLHISIYYAWILFSDSNERTFVLVENLISWLAPIVACVTLFIVSRQLVGKNRLFWLLLSLGAFSYAIAEGISVYSFNVLHKEPSYPGWPDVFYFFQIFFYLAAVVYQFKQKKEISYEIKFMFDIMIIITVSTALSWHFLIQYLLTEASSPMLLVVFIGYPIGDLLMLFGAISFYISFSYLLPTRVLALIITGLIFMVFADTAYLYSTVTDTYRSGILYAPLWSLSLLLVALAGLNALDPLPKNGLQATSTRAHERISIRMLLPYLSLLLLFTIMLVEQKENMMGLIAGAFVAAVLIITRQVFTLRDNRRLLFNYDQLTSILEHKIEQRTVEVTSKNEQLEKAVKQMEHMAYHDVLTNLPNRRLFVEKVENSIAVAKQNGQKLAVVFIDLDRFKNINDTFGHEFGDLLLQAFSQKILANLRPIDTISRQGGDEFTLFLADIHLKTDVIPIIRRLQSDFAKPMNINGQELPISMSIGIAMYPEDGETPSELLKHADSAMYSAKAKGKNNYQFFSTDMTFVTSSKLVLENDLRRAFSNEEFFLHYQPQVCASSGDVIGMEALIRWQKAEGTIVSPAEFIPLAEETRLILPIGEWVLDTACKQVKEWHDSGYPHLKLAVNLSPLQFLQDDLMETISLILATTHFPAALLELEITESVALDDAEKAISRMHALRKMGIQMAIDDFGTGYSSLNYLKRFPLNNLKIAQPFVQDMTTNPYDKALVEAMIFIAHSFDMSVIAEGVETEEQLALLKELGCDEIQGYLFSRPLPADRFTQLLVTGFPSVKMI